MDHTKIEAIRYLCAAAYLDSSFRDRVINQLIHNMYRAVGRCYGINLEAVLRHCTSPRNRLLHRDIALFIIWRWRPVWSFCTAISFYPFSCGCWLGRLCSVNDMDDSIRS
jgi:hypothetical protein